jgi:CRISPR system Cascade subunit CasA
MTGDPWTPIDLEEGKALTIGENGFQYNLIKEILLGQRYKLPPAVNPEGLDDTGGFLIATSLVRGEGKTHGFHHRVIPIPGKAAKIFRDPHEKETLAEQADRMVHTVAQFESEILGPALKKLLQPKNSEIGDNKKLSKQQQKKYRQWVQQYSANVEDTFFPMLWASIDMTSEAAQRAWKQRLFDLAREQLEDAIQSCPLPAIHRYRAISTAENVFYGSAHNRLDIFDTPESDKEETNESIAG